MHRVGSLARWGRPRVSVDSDADAEGCRRSPRGSLPRRRRRGLAGRARPKCASQSTDRAGAPCRGSRIACGVRLTATAVGGAHAEGVKTWGGIFQLPTYYFHAPTHMIQYRYVALTRTVVGSSRWSLRVDWRPRASRSICPPHFELAPRAIISRLDGRHSAAVALTAVAPPSP